MDPSGSLDSRRPAFQLDEVALNRDFLSEVSNEQRWLYGDFLRRNDLQLRKEGIANPKNWVFFAPLHHAQSGLLTPDLVTKAQQGAEVLIVGAGCGDLERYLIRVSKVQPGSLTAADVDLSNYPADLGVKTVQFDIFDRWPVERDRYQYILIPETLGMALMFNPKVVKHQLSLDEMPEMVQIKFRILSDGPRAVPRDEVEQFMEWAYRSNSPAAFAWSVIESGMQHLAPGGELRINGHCLKDEDITSLLVLAERAEVPISRVSFGRHSIVFQREG